MQLTPAQRFKKPAAQIPLAVHGPAQHHGIAEHFVKKYVLIEWAEHEKEAKRPRGPIWGCARGAGRWLPPNAKSKKAGQAGWQPAIQQTGSQGYVDGSATPYPRAADRGGDELALTAGCGKSQIQLASLLRGD